MRYLYFGNPISFVYFLLSFQVLLNMLTGLWHIERKQGERICFTNGLGFCHITLMSLCAWNQYGSLNSSEKVLRSRRCLSTNPFFLGIPSRVIFGYTLETVFKANSIVPQRIQHDLPAQKPWTPFLLRDRSTFSALESEQVLMLVEEMLCFLQGKDIREVHILPGSAGMPDLETQPPCCEEAQAPMGKPTRRATVLLCLKPWLSASITC